MDILTTSLTTGYCKRGMLHSVRVRVRVRVRARVTLWLVVYRQTVRLGDKSLQTHDQHFFQLNTCFHSPQFTIAAGPRQSSHFQVRLPRDSWPHFTVSNSRFPHLEGQIPVLISPRNRVAQIYPQALGALFVAFFDSQDCGGGIRTRLHPNL
jgi:hypothetical protein